MQRFTIIASLLLLFAMPVSSIPKCKHNTYVAAGSTDKQSCIDCPRCDAGYGYNVSYKRQQDKSRGFLDCFPCTPCPKGKYRENESVLDTCIYCPLNCSSVNRYIDRPCKENTRGSCGSCFHGYEPETLEPNSICVLRQNALPQADLKVVEPQAISTVSPATKELNASHNITMIVSISISAALILIMLLVVLMKKGFPNLCSEHGRRGRGKNTTASVEMHLLETVTTLSSTDGIELDGQGQSEINSRHNILTSEQYFQSEIANKNIAGEQHKTIAARRYPEIPLYIENPLVCIISKKVTGEKRFKFFESLGLENCDWEPDNELFLHGSHSHSAYIFEVLKKWIGIAGKDATIAKLFSALEKAQFNNIVADLLKSSDFDIFGNSSANGDHAKSDSDTNAADNFEVVDGD